MATSILVTKLFVPPTRAKLVHRLDLIERLNNGLDRKLTLLSAPAGFGKTTLVSHWVEHLQGVNEIDSQPIQVAWLSLDQDDNDPVRILTYFITALNQIKGIEADLGQGALSMLQSPQPPSPNSVLISLINDLAAISEKIIFVLDDYHLIESKEIHQALIFLLENLPSQLHLAIATRQDPPLSLGRLRARDQINEVRAAELRFSIDEAADFLNQVMGLDLSPSQVAELEHRTEGWIAGLQLAAISMQGREDVQGFIRSFSGTNRLVLDFLIEEVLGGLESDIQDFLLQTSILKRLYGPLCDALTGRDNSQAVLEELDQANLFIVPLDEERCWYRYHHLISDLLRQRLVSHHGGSLKELHGKASKWYEENEDLSEAVHHALAGEDPKSAIGLIKKGALAALEDSDFRFILDSVNLLPAAVLQNEPWLFIYHTWALLLTGHVVAARPKLENLDWLLEYANDENEFQQRIMLGNIAGLKVFLAGWLRDYEKLLEYAQQVRLNLPENNWIRGYCAMMVGSSYWQKGDLEQAREAFAESASVGIVSGNYHMAVSATCQGAHSFELAGRLKEACDMLLGAYELAPQDGRISPVIGYIDVGYGRILYEFNEIDLAEQKLEQSVKFSQYMLDERVEKIGYFLLAKVHMANGDYQAAQRSIARGENAVNNREIDHDLKGAEFPQIRLWIREGNFPALKAWLEVNDPWPGNNVHLKIRLTYTMHARALVALSREFPEEPYLTTATDLLGELYDMAVGNGWGNKIIEILCLQALAYGIQDEDDDRAIEILAQALKRAAPEGYIRTFVDEGPPMAQLLYEALKREIETDYVQRLLAAFPVPDPKEDVSKKPQVDQSGLIEPLSDREIDVLQFLAKGLTNQAIATRLFLSIHTVKTHTRNIYSKLGVKNRTQAVDRARTLGILHPI